MPTTRISVRAQDPGNGGRAFPWPTLEAGNMSFPNGNYTIVCEDKEPGQSFTLRHQVAGAPLLERWLDENKVAYICSVAAPRSMYRKLHKSDAPEQLIAWRQQDLGEPPMFTPMIVAREAIQHKAAAETDGLNPIWNGIELAIPKGGRIAIGSTFGFKSGIDGMLDFKEDKDLSDGTFKVTANTDGEFKFKVDLAPNLHRYLRHRRIDDPAGTNIMVHIVSRAFGILQEDWDKDDGEEGWRSFRSLISLADKLEEKGVPHWADETFHPEYAATTLYPHILPPPEG